MRALILIASAVCCCWANSEPVEVKTHGSYMDGKVMRIPMTDTATEETLDKWLSQALSGLMAAVASHKLQRLRESDKAMVHQCSQKAHNVPEHARCVVKLLDSAKRNHTKVIVPMKDKPEIYLKHKPAKKSEDVEWIGGFGRARVKRQTGYKVVNRASYELKSEQDGNIMAKIAKSMAKTVRKFKGKDRKEGWKQTMKRVKALAKAQRDRKKKRAELKKKLQMMIHNTPEQYMDPRKPLAMKQMEMEDEQIAEQKQKNMNLKKDIRVPMQVLRDGIKLALSLGGQNVTNFDKKTLKLVSPRFMSVVPDQEEDMFSLMSPSLFSLHEEGDDAEQMLSLPNMLKKLNANGQEEWLDFIIEASGVTDTIDKTEKQLKEREQAEDEMRGTGGVPLYFDKKNVSETLGDVEVRKIETFEALGKTYNAQQKEELGKLGYSFMTDEQLETVYGDKSPYKKTDSLKRFKELRLRDEPHEHIEHDIRALAEAEKFKVRRKDIVGSPFVLTPLTFAGTALSQPVILSPLVLSPITLSPAVLGPIILSPWVFIPLVLSPRVLSPLILTPLVFSPIILSPLVLHPLILVPGVFNPLVLSPLVLSPLILSPQVFTPLILSPMVLNPLILTPMALSPLVLSPFVLSPIILSPQFFTAIVLSPYAASPLVESKLVKSEVVLSPSWLS